MLAEEICDQAGKPIALAQAEVERALATFRLAADEARRITGDVLPLDLAPASRGRWGMTRRFPRGVVTGIVPFNFPLNLAAHKLAPALAAGCSIILKPPPQAPGPTVRLGEIAAEAGLPAGAVNVILPSVENAAPLVDDPRVAVLSFTGSADVGWKLKARAPRKQVILELGGNAAVIIDETADLDHAAARCAVAGFAYAGQVCIKAQRLFVHRAVYPAFREKFLEAVARIVKVGEPRDPKVLCGPVIDDAAADRIEAWVEDALSDGARRLLPQERRERLISPIVLEEVPRESRVSCDEVFGPVVILAPVDDFAEGIARVNDSPYGLQAGVFTNDMRHALRAFESIEAGGVIVNEASTFRVDAMPYGGTKASGFGREGLHYAIKEMTELRLLVLPPA
jgi:glyceraldehyde-3-phosphate dehydrogenase (NADP+)